MGGSKHPSLAWPLDARLLVSGSKDLIEGCLRFKIDERLDIQEVYANLVNWPISENSVGGEESSSSDWPTTGKSDSTTTNAMDLNTGVLWIRSRLKGKGLISDS